jgi:antitoxin YefM
VHRLNRINFSELRQNLVRYLNEIEDSGTLIVVTRPGTKGNVVMLSEHEFCGWQETVHLLINPANSELLLRSIRAADAHTIRQRGSAKTKG